MWPNVLLLLTFFAIQVSCEQKNSLTIVIDNTGSMNDELSQVKAAAKSIVDIVLNEKASQIEDIVLVTFNDPKVEFRKRTRDADELKRSLDGIRLYNGWCEEMSLSGTKLALEESLPGSYLFVFTDAGSHDLNLEQDVISLCQEKQSQIVFVLTGECGDMSIYYRIAKASNGQVFRISKNEISQVLEYVKETIKGDRSVLTTQLVTPRKWHAVPFIIDDKTEYAVVSASGTRVQLLVKDNQNNQVSGYTQLVWTDNVKAMKLANLRPGTYNAHVYGDTVVNVKVVARTNFTFDYGFSNKQETSLSLTETQPTIGAPTHLMIAVKDEEHSVTVQTVQVLDMDETVLATYSLTDMGGNVYATGQFVPPDHTFKVAMTATGLITEKTIRRIAKTPVKPIRPVLVAPEIIGAGNLKKIEGSSVDLHCRIRRGRPKPHITWFFKQQGAIDFVGMTNRTDEVLHLTNVTQENDGQYKCVAKNTVSSAELTVRLEVEVAPKISDSGIHLMRGREGSTVDITCRIEKGNPKPHITWFFKRQGTRDFVEMTHKTDEVLHLTNVLIENDGQYKCVAENTVARAEYSVQLEVEVAPKILDSGIRVMREREGSTAAISCRIEKGNPKPHIKWFFKRQGARDFVEMTHKTDEVLHLTNVLTENDGQYKCVAENTVARAEHSVQLEVEVTPKILDSGIHLMRGREGTTAAISCRIEKGNPKPHITWFFKRQGARGFVEMTHKTDEVLHLTNVLIENDGQYKCVAENTVARTEHSVQFEVEVAPKILNSERHLMRRENSTVDINCRIEKGNPKPHITWYFKQQGATDFVKIRDKTNEILRLTNVLVNDEGLYKCEARNTVARAEHSVQLEVEVAPKIWDFGKYLKKTEGVSVSIHCRILRGKPQPQISWFFKQQGAIVFKRVINRTEQVLNLMRVRTENAGEYKCVAENVVNRAEHIVHLVVQVPPRIVFSPPNAPKYRGVEGDVVMKLPCIAEGLPIPVISWIIDNSTIGTDKSKQSYVEDGSLFLKNPTKANSNNTFVCVATNAVGEQQQTYAVLISEFEDYDNPEKRYGEVGKPYEINCSLPFTDPNSVRWFYNSVYLNVTGPSIRWEAASQAHDGNYSCRVSDSRGAASATVELVFGLPPSPSAGDTEWEVEWDDRLQIACAADLSLDGKYEWFHNGHKIEGADENELSVYKFGFGNYTCRASNSLGTLNITYNIPTQDCVIDKSLWEMKNMPIILDNNLAWPAFTNNQRFVVVPHSETVHLVCKVDPSRSRPEPQILSNSFKKFPSMPATLATCDHQDVFLVDGIPQNISELDCIQPVTPRIIRSGKQCLGQNTETIDVGLHSNNTFIKVFSSCVDTSRNLLLYTTVSMKGSDVSWEVEPEKACKQVGDCCYETDELVQAKDVGLAAARWFSLEKPLNTVFYCRTKGDTNTDHCGQHNELLTAATESRRDSATDTSPRAAADTEENQLYQHSTTARPCREPETSWHDIERQVRNGPRMTVWSGVGNYTKVGDLMVPQYLWKVVKDLDSDQTVAIVHSNAHAALPKLCEAECDSPLVLPLFEPHGLRTYCCGVEEFKTAFNLPLEF